MLNYFWNGKTPCTFFTIWMTPTYHQMFGKNKNRAFWCIKVFIWVVKYYNWGVVIKPKQKHQNNLLACKTSLLVEWAENFPCTMNIIPFQSSFATWIWSYRYQMYWVHIPSMRIKCTVSFKKLGPPSSLLETIILTRRSLGLVKNFGGIMRKWGKKENGKKRREKEIGVGHEAD